MNFMPDKNWEFLVRPGGRDSSVGMETRYGLELSGIVAQRGQDFPHPSRSADKPSQSPGQGAPGLFPLGKVV